MRSKICIMIALLALIAASAASAESAGFGTGIPIKPGLRFYNSATGIDVMYVKPLPKGAAHWQCSISVQELNKSHAAIAGFVNFSRPGRYCAVNASISWPTFEDVVQAHRTPIRVTAIYRDDDRKVRRSKTIRDTEVVYP